MSSAKNTDDEEKTGAAARIPPWLSGHDVLGFAATAQLKFHPVDVATQRWRIEALERYERRSARLVELIEIAAPGDTPRWEALEALPFSQVGPTLTPEQLQRKRDELVNGDSQAWLNWIHMSLMLAPNEDFVAAARGAYESLQESGSAENGPMFPDLAAYFIRFDQALTWREAFTRVMLRVEEEPHLLTNRPQQSTDQLVFGAGTWLLTDLALTRDAYLVPLFLCHSPWVWAIAGQRVQGVIVLSLGRHLRGRESDAAELLQQFMPAGTARPTPRPPFTAQQIAATLTWWTEHLNGLLSTVSDPATYCDAAGEYRPRRQFNMQLTFEQAGRRIQAVLTNQRDQPTRRLAAFAALDTLEGLGLTSFDTAVDANRAQKILDRLEHELLPDDVAAVLLPSARRAVQALRDLQKGFFPTTWVNGGQVSVPDKKGRIRTMTPEQAVAQYLRILRNAHHGFAGQNDSGRRRDEVLLMSHTGEIPDDFALLPYLYWLHALADHRILRAGLAPR